MTALGLAWTCDIETREALNGCLVSLLIVLLGFSTGFYPRRFCWSLVVPCAGFDLDVLCIEPQDARAAPEWRPPYAIYETALSTNTQSLPACAEMTRIIFSVAQDVSHKLFLRCKEPPHEIS